MRKTLLTLTALAGLAGAGVFTSASAALPSGFDPAMVQPAQYYHGGWRDGDGWRGREQRRHEWERHRHWVEYHRWHHGW